MLPGPASPKSLPAASENPRWVFTAPRFATFTALTAGLIADTGAGT